jgi:putative membrane protein
MRDAFAIAYCGPPATPGDLLTRWNLDPLLIAAFGALAIVIASGRVANARAGWGAVGLLVVIFISPLCALSSALFSARVLHHVLLIAAVAPLLALAVPMRRLASPPLAVLVGTHGIILWVWHLPGPYQWGLASVPSYWLMQASLLGSAWLLWRAILAPTTQFGPSLVALGATSAQMGFLAALIVFAPRPLYAVHFASTAAWGMTPLADQQLAGLLMWAPASLPHLGVGLWLAWSSLRLVESPA